TSGEVLVEEVLTNRGGPARPLSDDELATKFADNVAGRLDADAASVVRRAVAGLRTATDVTDLLSPLKKEFR
ncbi:MmgE/PrpD family protein, partial [Nocardioides hankookensis]